MVASTSRRLTWLVPAIAALVFGATACDGGDSSNSTGMSAMDPASREERAGGSRTQSRLQDDIQSVADVAESAGASVVRVGVNCQDGESGTCAGSGSGWLYDDDGHFVTNNHVVTLGGQAGDPENVTLTTRDGREIEATLVGRDPLTDLAVLEADTADMERLELANLSEHRIGDPVIAIGYALDLGGSPSVTTGVISALERQILDPRAQFYGLVQTDAAINPGNSGGPLLNHAGRVVGVNTATLQGAEGIGFAVGADTVRIVVDEILEQGSVDRGFIGIGFQEVSPGLAQDFDLPVDRGIRVEQVQPGSPADEAGLEPGDVITRLGDSDIRFTSDLTIALTEHAPGDEVEVRYYRDGEEEATEVRLGEPPDGR